MDKVTLYPAFEKNNIAIACSSDEKYLPYTMVMINSLLSHASHNYNYDIVIIEDAIKENSKDIIKKYFQKYSNFSVRFFNMTQYIGGSNLNWTTPDSDKWSSAMYYRMFIPWIFAEYDKVIYLDGDIVNLRDIAIMYAEDITGYLIGAVRLLGRVIVGSNDMLDDTYIGVNDYLPEVEMENYFNSGVLLFNNIEFRKRYTEKEIVEIILQSSHYWLVDQDCLNVLCAKNVKYVDAGWNFHPYTCEDFVQYADCHIETGMLQS